MTKNPKLPLDRESFSLFGHPVFLAFAASIIYWIYLFFTSTMAIAHDSIGYQSLGTLIYEQGWVPYFQTGPNREPFYPFIISISISLGKIFSVSYHPFQKLIQLLLLFLTQLLTLKILKDLKVRDTLISLCVLYLGFSPALVNSALSLYSEIVTYPCLLSIIYLSSRAWLNFESSQSESALLGLLCGLAFTGITFIKGIFEIITPIFLIIFMLFATVSFMKKNSRSSVNSLTFLLVFLLAFYIPVNLYKSFNEKYNGHFALTNRGAWALYGNTARRMDPIAMEKLPAALLYAPGEGVCKRVIDEESCRYWSFERSDELGYGKLHEVSNQNAPDKNIDKKMIHLSVKEILRNPPQYILFAGIEGLKMIFWESTQIGFVHYPGWLTTLFNFTPFKDGLRLIMSLLSFTALFYLTGFVWKRRSNIFSNKENTDEQTITIFITFVLIIIYIAIHSFFFILTRYTLPIAPLYLIMITFYLDRIISGSNNSKTLNSPQP